MTVITLGTSLRLVLCCQGIDPMSGLRCTNICHSLVIVKLSALKSIVNKLSCPKCQVEFLKGPVSDVADLFNSMTSIHDTYFMHTYICCVLITVSAIFFIE